MNPTLPRLPALIEADYAERWFAALLALRHAAAEVTVAYREHRAGRLSRGRAGAAEARVCFAIGKLFSVEGEFAGLVEDRSAWCLPVPLALPAEDWDLAVAARSFGELYRAGASFTEEDREELAEPRGYLLFEVACPAAAEAAWGKMYSGGPRQAQSPGPGAPRPP